MYKKIMVPIDLEHADKMEKAVNSATVLAKAYGAAISMVGVTGSVLHSPDEYQQQFIRYAAKQSDKYGIDIKAVTYFSVDVEAELRSKLENEAEKNGYDLIVIASHHPGLLDYIFSSNAEHMVTHAKASVFIVRE